MRIFKAKTAAEAVNITAKLSKTLESESAPCYVFCEDKSTLSIELKLAELYGGSFFTSVLSFSRYISKKVAALSGLSKTGSALIVERILNERAEDISRFNPYNKPNMAKSLYELIAQLKSAKVTPDDIFKICKNLGGGLGTKLFDIYTVYDGYEKALLKGGYLDGGNLLSLMPPLIEKDEKLVSAHVIVSGYGSLTRQSVEIFNALIKKTDVDFVVIDGEGDLYTHEMMDKLVELYPKSEIIESGYAYSAEAQKIERGLFNPKIYSEAPLKTDNIRVIEAQNPYKEAENIAKRIRYEVVKNGLSYKDFVIASGDTETYGRILKNVFANYEIPLYSDVKKTLEKHPLVRLTLDIADAIRLNMPLDSFIGLSAEPLLFDREMGEAFSAYALNAALSRKNLVSPFTFEDENRENAEKVRLRINELLSCFRFESTTKEFIDALRSAFEKFGIFTRAEKLNGELEELGETLLSDYGKRAAERFNLMLDEIEGLMGDRRITVGGFKSLVASSAAATEIPMMPQYVDNVFMGDFKSAGRRFCKIFFAVGLTQDVPQAKDDCALLTDRELYRMDEYRCVVEPKIRVVNERERENCGIGLMSFENKLFLSYPRQDAFGAAVSKSEIVDYFTAMFDGCLRSEDEARLAGIYREDEDIYGYMALGSGVRKMLKDAERIREGAKISSENIAAFCAAARLLGVPLDENGLIRKEQAFFVEGGATLTDKLSATAIEGYFSCPYSSFVKNALKLKERESGEFDPLKTGILLHAVFEGYVKRLGEVDGKTKSDSLAAEVFDKKFNELGCAKYLNKSKYGYLFGFIKNETVRRCYKIYDGFTRSKFKPYKEEVKFGELEGAELNPILLSTSYGDVKINGVIDRIDRYEGNIRIIDYKTGRLAEKIKDNAFYMGSAIQLYLYANAPSSEDKLVGAYYYSVDDGYQAEGGEEKSFFGKTLSSREVFEATDKNIASDLKSAEYDLALDVKSENLSPKKSSSTLTEQEFSAYISYAKAVATVGAEEIFDGNITPTPLKIGQMASCAYCKFGGMCGYDCETDKRTRTSVGDKNAIVAAKTEMDSVNAEENGDE